MPTAHQRQNIFEKRALASPKTPKDTTVEMRETEYSSGLVRIDFANDDGAG